MYLLREDPIFFSIEVMLTCTAHFTCHRMCSLARFLRGEMEEAALHAKNAHRLWVDSGRLRIRNVLGAPSGELSLSLWRICDLVACGRLAGEASVIWDMEIEGWQCGTSGKMTGYTCAAFGEALWEPPNSARVRELLQYCAKEIMFSSSDLSFESKGGSLSAAWISGLEELCMIAEAANNPGGGQSWVTDLTGFVSRAAKRRSLQAYLIPAATRILARKAWASVVSMHTSQKSSSANNTPSPSNVGLSKALWHCIRVWEDVLAVAEDASSAPLPFLGASLEYCKVVLRLLDNAPWGNVDIRQGISDLVHLWSMSVNRQPLDDARLRCPEPLTAGLPTAIAICHLVSKKKSLRSRQPRMSLGSQTKTVGVPANLSCIFDTEDTEELIDLELGSLGAMAWAASQLEALLDTIEAHVWGDPNQPNAGMTPKWRGASGPSGVKGSESIWEAIQLWQRLVQECGGIEVVKAQVAASKARDEHLKKIRLQRAIKDNPNCKHLSYSLSSPFSTGALKARLRKMFNLSDAHKIKNKSSTRSRRSCSKGRASMI